MTAEATPARIGPWILGRKLGQGGFGAVFEAVHASHPDVHRALKWIPNPDADARARFVREAELLARIQHPGIVRVHEAGQLPQGVYLVLELVSGKSLRSLMDERKASLPLESACALAIAIARAVGAAHAHGVAHRDLKPENVLVEPSAGEAKGDLGSPRVIDFGLAVASDSERLTLSGMRLGTMGYMAPEQVDGRRSEQGPATDVFALGAIFYELLTGDRPYQGSELQVVTAMARARFDPPTRRRPELPAWVDEVVARALAHRPSGRHPDGEAFARSIEAGRSGALTSQRRRRRTRRFALAVVALGLAGGAGAFVLERSAAQQRALAEATRIEGLLAKLDLQRATDATVGPLARDRAALPSWSGDADIKQRIDAALRIAERRVRLREGDEAKAVAAAFDLVAEDAAALRDRVGGVEAFDEALRLLVKAADADPKGLGKRVEGLHRTAGVAPGLVRLRIGQAKAAAGLLAKVALLRRANDTDSSAFQQSFAAWSLEEPPPPAALDATIELGQAMLSAAPASGAHGAVQKRLAALLLRRCELRRATDARGALLDRQAAALADSEAPSPPWYQGFVQRVARRSTDPEATPAEQELAFPALVELVAEDAAWGMTASDIQRLVQARETIAELRDPSHGVETEIVFTWILRFNRDLPEIEPLHEPIEAREPKGRLAAPWRALERRSWRTIERLADGSHYQHPSEEQARPPSSTWSPEIVAAAVAAIDVARAQRDRALPHATIFDWLDKAFEQELKRAETTRALAAASPGDADLALSLDIELMRAAAIRETRSTLAFESLDRTGKNQAELVVACREIFDLLRDAVRINPPGTGRAFWSKVRLAHYLSKPDGIDAPRELLAMRESLVTDPLWRQTLEDPDRAEVSWQTDVARASYWFAFAYLELDPPDTDRAEAERQRGRTFADRAFELGSKTEMLRWDESIRARIEAIRAKR